MLRRPRLAPTGQVAAWVGVGGPRLGAGGRDAWIQVGLVAFGDGTARIYHEVTRPGQAPVFTQVAADVPARAPHRFAVERVARDRWVARVDGRRVAGPVHLEGSGSWRPVATAETWVRGGRGCNVLGFGFAGVVTRTPGGWSPLEAPTWLADRGYGIAGARPGAFRAVSRVDQ
jgi:hypothetical protein